MEALVAEAVEQLETRDAPELELVKVFFALCHGRVFSGLVADSLSTPEQ